MKKIATLLLSLSLALCLFFPALPVRAESPEELLRSLDVSELTDKLKDSLDDIRAMSDQQLAEEIRALAGEYHLTLNDEQVAQLTKLCRQITETDKEKLEEKVEEKAEELKEALKKITAPEESAATVNGFFSSLLTGAKSLFDRASDFLSRMIETIAK